MAIASDQMVFYYMSRDNLCFLALCEESYPKRQAFLYLDDIADLILAELLNEHGTNVRFLVVMWCTTHGPMLTSGGPRSIKPPVPSNLFITIPSFRKNSVTTVTARIRTTRN